MAENTKSPLLIILIVLVVALITLQQTGWKLFQADDSSASTTAAVETDTKPASTEPEQYLEVDMVFGFDDVELLVKALSPQQREQLLSNPEMFKQLIQQEINFRSMLKGASGSGLTKDQSVRLLMERAASRVLAESYLMVLLNKNIEGKMPTEQDVEDFYNANPQEFEMPDRIYLSQIFFASTDTNEDEVMARAQKVHAELTTGKADFGSLATKYSEHPSKANGGEMGPININGMLPEIRDAVQQMKENEISAPLKSPTGIHIVRRGGVIKTPKLTLEQARQRIMNSLVQGTQNKLRMAIVAKLVEKFPVSIETTDDLDSWRTRLMTTE